MNGKRTMSWIKNSVAGNIIAALFGLILSFLILEIFLRFYNPFGFRIKSDKIVLYPYKKYLMENSSLRGVDSTIKHTRNSLGLRGPNPPADFASALTVVAVGGSTTEGFYLSDGKTWPERLSEKLSVEFPGIWINNAGLDGQSSYGHIVFTRDYLSKLKPKIAVFYCGLNDVGLSAMNRYDSSLTGEGDSLPKKLLRFLTSKSEVFSTAANLYLYFSSRKAAITHGNLNPLKAERRHLSRSEIKSLLDTEKNKVKDYGSRLSELVRICRGNGIEPVFISQSSLCSAGKDISTGVEMGGISLENKFGSCEAFGEILSLYNNKMHETAIAEKVFFIDAASMMPKDSSLYYDLFHFNNAGADIFAQKISGPFSTFLKKKYNISRLGSAPGLRLRN